MFVARSGDTSWQQFECALLEFRRGRGITVTGTPQHGAVAEHAKELLRFARSQGYRPDELIRIIEKLG